MHVLITPKGLVIAIGLTVGSIMAGAQTALPSPANQPPPNIENAKTGYTIDRGMPYSGVWITSHITTFPGGQVAKDENTRKVWRDSDGRTREDMTWKTSMGALVTVCRIEDPVAQVRYTWRIEQAGKTVVTATHFNLDKYDVAEIWSYPPSHPIQTLPGTTVVILRSTRVPHPDSKGEKLGPTYMNGVYAEGVRTEEPIPSDPTRHRIDEIWSAPDLNLVVKTYLDDGNGFIEYSELKNIDRSEPDSSVFVPPSDIPLRQAPESDPVWNESYGAN